MSPPRHCEEPRRGDEAIQAAAPGVMPTRRIATFLAALVLSFAAPGPGQAQETKLAVMVFRGGQNLPLFAAQEKGFLVERGLQVNVVYAPSADELPRVLADGRV